LILIAEISQNQNQAFQTTSIMDAFAISSKVVCLLCAWFGSPEQDTLFRRHQYQLEQRCGAENIRMFPLPASAWHCAGHRHLTGLRKLVDAGLAW
jgi:hypothetical protein